MSHKVFLSGIYSEGYGMIAKSVMRDKYLTIEAKAIYSYLVSFSGAGLSSFPSTKLMLSDLGISHKRYLNHRKQLEEKGYIEITRERTSNGFSKNKYRIISDLSVSGRFVHVQDVHEQNVHEQDVGAISNSFISNSNISNSSIKDNVDSNESTIPFKEIIDYLNKKTNREFRNVESNKRLIRARWNEGYRLDDFKKVIDNMVSKWGEDNKMMNYLRPTTLFGTKFDDYLNTVTNKQEEIELDIKLW